MTIYCVRSHQHRRSLLNCITKAVTEVSQDLARDLLHQGAQEAWPPAGSRSHGPVCSYRLGNRGVARSRSHGPVCSYRLGNRGVPRSRSHGPVPPFSAHTLARTRMRHLGYQSCECISDRGVSSGARARPRASRRSAASVRHAPRAAAAPTAHTPPSRPHRVSGVACQLQHVSRRVSSMSLGVSLAYL